VIALTNFQLAVGDFRFEYTYNEIWSLWVSGATAPLKDKRFKVFNLHFTKNYFTKM
jgi:hypothetical protein